MGDRESKKKKKKAMSVTALRDCLLKIMATLWNFQLKEMVRKNCLSLSNMDVVIFLDYGMLPQIMGILLSAILEGHSQNLSAPLIKFQLNFPKNHRLEYKTELLLDMAYLQFFFNQIFSHDNFNLIISALKICHSTFSLFFHQSGKSLC